MNATKKNKSVAKKTRGKEKDQLAPAIYTWIATNLANGGSEEAIIQVLSQKSVPKTVVSEAISFLKQPKLAEIFAEFVREQKRTLQLQQLLKTVAQKPLSPTSITRRETITAEEFYQEFYATNTPVVLTKTAAHWPAVQKWSPAFFRKNFGHVEVEVTTGRESDPDYDMNTRKHSEKMKLSTYIKKVESVDSSNDFYFVAQNHNITNPGLQSIWNDIDLPVHLLKPENKLQGTALWIGPKGTVTPLHHDTCNILFFQIHGKKRFTMYPPWESWILRGARSMYAAFDPENPSGESFPEYASAAKKVVDLGPGEVLFLPVGWWHHVRSLDVSISLAMANLYTANNYDWYVPGNI